MKDWVGGFRGVFTTLGAENHSDKEREVNDYYATDPKALDLFLPAFKPNRKIWEPSCGEGHLSKRLEEFGFDVLSTDLVDRGYGKSGVDFFKTDRKDIEVWWADGNPSWLPFDILTNPPYRYATDYVLHAIDIIPEGGHVILFLKTSFLEGKERKERIYDINPPKYIFQYSGRMVCAKNGKFEHMRKIGSAVAYAMYVWDKKNTGDTVIRWV